jgi:hypothetical protein
MREEKEKGIIAKLEELPNSKNSDFDQQRGGS